MGVGMRRFSGGLTALALVGALAACAPAAAQGPQRDYLVFYADGGQGRAVDAIRAGGGSAVATEGRLGYVLARADDGFVDRLGDSDAIVGVSTDRRIGSTAAAGHGRTASGAAGRTAPDVNSTVAKGEPLAKRQWDMRMIGADRANRTMPGSRKVLVGVIDTGIDGKHPDIAPNFNRELSRNFVTDRPKDPNGETVDGPCEYKGCKDPVDIDDDGHGTHVASTIASPLNGKGIAGVAPGVQLVNLRAGQDSGLFFLKPSLDALTYAADIGVDVVNMSYYVDPWLFNCANAKGDSKRERLEQRGVITGMQRALDYARGKGVTLISALGNGSLDLGKPRADASSPNYPQGGERSRKVDNSCLNVPAESKGVISVSSVGPSGGKARYSDYGIEQADLAAPGGDMTDGGGLSPTRSILAAAPEAVLRREGKIGKSGAPTTTEVVRDCTGGTCAYYQYLDGTSMAAPHATGVAALLISRFGEPGKGGLHLAPKTVESMLYASAARKACPSPRAHVYEGFGEAQTHTCEGSASKNGFYGRGVVDAWNAVTIKK